LPVHRTRSRTRLLRRVLSSALVVGLVVAGACSSDDGKIAVGSKVTAAPTTTEATETTDAEPATTAATKIPDPCELVPIDAASQLLPGAVLQPGVVAGPGDDKMCQYAGDPSGPTAQVEIYVGAGAKKSLDIDKDALAHEFTMPTGIGDEAYLEDSNVFFRKGTLWVQIRVVTLDVDPAVVQANLTTLATTVAQGL